MNGTLQTTLYSGDKTSPLIPTATQTALIDMAANVYYVLVQDVDGDLYFNSFDVKTGSPLLTQPVPFAGLAGFTPRALAIADQTDSSSNLQKTAQL